MMDVFLNTHSHRTIIAAWSLCQRSVDQKKKARHFRAQMFCQIVSETNPRDVIHTNTGLQLRVGLGSVQSRHDTPALSRKHIVVGRVPRRTIDQDAAPESFEHTLAP
jgi:hypothetical protein